MKNNTTMPVKVELLEGFRDLCAVNKEIILVSLCTTDGFTIKSFAEKKLQAEADKIAAMVSTLCALSDSSAKQILSDQFNLSIIETDSGNILLVSTDYLGMSCVLAVAARSQMSLATARFATKRLAKLIGEIQK